MAELLLRYESPSIEAPFKRNAEEIAELYFSSAVIEKAGQFTVISENNVNHLIIQELKIFADENKNGIYDAGEQVYQNYNLMVFISKDVSYLQAAFENTDPEPGDVCIYLEDNSSDTFSGKSAWKMEGYSDIIVGPKVKDELTQWFSGSGSSTFNQFAQLGEQFGFNIDFSQDEMSELIKNGELRNAARTFAIGIFQFFNGFNILAAPLYSAIGDLILTATKGLRSYIEFQDYHWDPEAKIPAGNGGEMKDNPDFNPILLPFSHKIIDSLSELEDAGIGEVAEMLQIQLLKEKNNIKSRLRQFSNLKSAGIIVPENLISLLEKCADYISSIIDKVRDTCKIVPALFASLGKKWLNAINAFYCGLWNSLVEAVLGFVDMVGYFFVAFGIIGDATANAQTLIPQAYEVLDEAIQTILEADIVGILFAAFNAIIEGVGNFNLYALTGTISLEKVAYFVGGIIGFVVQIVASIFWSGGMDGLRAAITNFGKVGEDILSFLIIGTEKILGSAMKFSVESMLTVVRKIIELIKKGKEEIVEMIQSIFKALENAAELVDDIIQAIKRLLQLTDEEMTLIEQLGLKFVKFENNICSLCNVVDQ